MKVQRQTRIEKWLRNIHGKKPPAIILGSTANGLSFVRSLGRRGIPTFLLDIYRRVGMYTRYGRVLLLPPVEEHPEDWLELLEFIGCRLNVPGVIFSTSDILCVFISEQEDFLKRFFCFLVPNRGILERIINKRIQYSVADIAGIPIPKTYFPKSVEEVKNLAPDLPYPCILKPYKSYLGYKKIQKKVLVVRRREELNAMYSCIADSDVHFMVQEIIPGPDTAIFGYHAFWDAEGRENNWLTKQKLRQNPPHFGSGSLHITVDAPEVAKLSRHLLKAFSYRGFVGVEFKFDTRDHTYRLMEINPRTGLSNQMAIRAGVDFPWSGYCYLTGIESFEKTIKPFQKGVKFVHEGDDFSAYLALRKSEGLTFAQWFHSVRGSKAKAIGAWDDPLPMIVQVWRLLRKFFIKLFPGNRRISNQMINY